MSQLRWWRFAGLLFVVAAIIGPVAGCGRKAPTKNTAPAPVAEDPAPVVKVDLAAAEQPILLSVDELKTHLKNSKKRLGSFTRVIDARPKADYKIAHLPNAVHVDLEKWKTQSLAPNGLVDAAAWSKLVGEVGVTPAFYTIVYADQPTDAARVWWTLKYVGIPNVAVLDGGWRRWIDEHGEVTNDEPNIVPVETPISFKSDRLSQIGDLKTSFKSDGVKVIDARSEDEFGKGRIPGAVRVEWKDLLDKDGKFKTPDELRRIFHDRGLDEKKTAVAYCQSGGRASLDAFALELAGFKNVKNYYCSWQQWSGDASAPQEK